MTIAQQLDSKTLSKLNKAKDKIGEKQEAYRKDLLEKLKGKEKLEWDDNYLSFFWTVKTPSEDVLNMIWAKENLSDDAWNWLDEYYEEEQPSYSKQQARLYYEGDMVAYVNWKPADYETIDSQDSVDVKLANLWNGIWHVVIDCYSGNWVNTSFVLLDDDWKIIMSEDNINPNPVKQIGEDENYKA